MTDAPFVISDKWLDQFGPGPGSSWTQAMLEVIDPEAWPNGRRAPVAGWRDRLRGRVITQMQRLVFEYKVRESIRGDVAYHTTRLQAAKQRLEALDRAAVVERSELADWTLWETAPGVM